MLPRDGADFNVEASAVKIASNGPAVSFRQFRRADTEAVHKLYWKCNTEGAGSALQEGLKSNLTERTTVVPSIFSVLSIALAVTDPQYTVLAGVLSTACVAFVTGVRYFIKESTERFLKTAYETDMADIEDHYRLLDPESRGNFWIAEAVDDQGEKEIVGFVGFDTKNEMADPAVAELKRMCVSLDHRRRGIGAKLIKLLIAHARKHSFKRVTLSTTKGRTGAIEMYMKAGWVLRETKKYPLVPQILDIEVSFLDLNLD